ncbi:MAG: S8 family serine peptidase [Chloroflexota bacterium]
MRTTVAQLQERLRLVNPALSLEPLEALDLNWISREEWVCEADPTNAPNNNTNSNIPSRAYARAITNSQSLHRLPKQIDDPITNPQTGNQDDTILIQLYQILENGMVSLEFDWVAAAIQAADGETSDNNLGSIKPIPINGQFGTTRSLSASAISPQTTMQDDPIATANLNGVNVAPNHVLGDPHTVTGSGMITASAPITSFWSQWALNEQGIGLSDGISRHGDFLYEGNGVKVGVFDTSPFAAPGSATIPGLGGKVIVEHPTMFTQFATKADPPELNEHGLSIAGLISAVAPSAEIYLYRVLHDDASGDLFTLVNALHEFVVATSEPAVINLSLGISIPALDGTTNDLDCDRDIVALKTVLWSARNRYGIVTVAASGNDSKTETQIPAAWDSVIGVSASEPGYGLATYANHVYAPGNVAAPGGREGGVCTETNCLVAPSTSSSTGFTYWIGTSFATPLAAGAAALLIEERITNGLPDSPSATSGKLVSSVVPNTFDFGRGVGVIDLRCTSLVDPNGTLAADPTTSCGGDALPRVSASHVTAQVGEEITVAISVTNLMTGLNLSSLDTTIRYDASKLAVMRCGEAGSSQFDLIVCNRLLPGVIRINAAARAAIDTETPVVFLSFKVLGSGNEEIPIDVDTSIFASLGGTTIAHQDRDGLVTTLPPLTGDVNCDGSVNVIDASFILRFDVGLIGSTQACTDDSSMINETVCDVNGDSSCDVSDAFTIVQCRVGIANDFCPDAGSAPADGGNGVAAIDIISTRIPPGETRRIPIIADVSSGQIGVGTFEVHYDPTVIKAVGCGNEWPEGVAYGECNVDYAEGVVRFNALFAEGSMGDEVVLTNIEFEAVGNEEDSSALKLEAPLLTTTTDQSVNLTVPDASITLGPPETLSTRSQYLPIIKR